MKLSLFFFIIIVIFSACQQEGIPESTYDLNSQDVTLYTRESQASVLFESPVKTKEKQQVFVFLGYVDEIMEQPDQPAKVVLKNESDKELVFETQGDLIEKIAKDMQLIVRYALNDGEVELVEVRKES
ncbi:hypothetical protein OAK19_03550 [Aureispira]|nr:hypothetical protein [Aureispira sp.]